MQPSSETALYSMRCNNYSKNIVSIIMWAILFQITDFALHFDAEDDYVELVPLGDFLVNSSSSFAIEAWVLIPGAK